MRFFLIISQLLGAIALGRFSSDRPGLLSIDEGDGSMSSWKGWLARREAQEVKTYTNVSLDVPSMRCIRYIYVMSPAHASCNFVRDEVRGCAHSLFAHRVPSFVFVYCPLSPCVDWGLFVFVFDDCPLFRVCA